MSRQKADDGLVVPTTASAIDVNWLSGSTRKNISVVEFNYRR